jgi:hypothetical protein
MSKPCALFYVVAGQSGPNIIRGMEEDDGQYLNRCDRSWTPLLIIMQRWIRNESIIQQTETLVDETPCQYFKNQC